MDILLLPTATVAGTDATDDVYIHNPYPEGILVTNIDLLPNTSVATHANNYITTTVKNAAGDTLASHTTNSSGGSALTAGTVLNMPISGTTKQCEVAAGGVMRIQVAKAGTGPAYEHTVIVRANKRRGGV